MKYVKGLIFVLSVAALGLANEAKPRTFTFDKADVGKVPAGWKADKTGTGDGSVWQVTPDASAPSKSGYVLAQTAEGPSRLFNLCVVEDSRYTDLELHVAFKALKGKEDQGGGLVWRYQDANNYYLRATTRWRAISACTRSSTACVNSWVTSPT